MVGAGRTDRLLGLSQMDGLGWAGLGSGVGLSRAPREAHIPFCLSILEFLELGIEPP